MTETSTNTDTCPGCGVPPGMLRLEGCNAEWHTISLAEAASCDGEGRDEAWATGATSPTSNLAAGDPNRDPSSVEEADRRERVRIHWVIDNGWLHTHGMDRAGFPELEVRQVPGYLAEPASELLNILCDYMLSSGKRVKPGEVVAVSPRTSFRLIEPQPMPGDEDHYVTQRLQIIDVESGCHCCGARAAD